MALVIESTGSIESICTASSIKVGDSVKLTFRALEDSDPPYTVKVTSPGGKVVLERVLRELPDGRPQSAPPVIFNALVDGDYRVDIWQLYGKTRGQAVLHVQPIQP